MSRPRPGFWTRLGIVLSIVWIVGGSAYKWDKETDEAAMIASALHASCMEEKIATNDYNKVCGDTWIRDYRANLIGLEHDIALFTLVPLIAAWIVAYLTFFAGRWVWRGRSVA